MRHGKGVTDPEYTINRLFSERAGRKRQHLPQMSAANTAITIESWPMGACLALSEPIDKRPYRLNRHAVVVRWRGRNYMIDGSRRVRFWASVGKQWMRVYVCHAPYSKRTMKERNAGAIRHRYVGRVAENYESRRVGRADWQAEQRAVADLLSDVPAEAHILDAPVGTGRFATIYRERGFAVIGIDSSPDMLEIAGTAMQQAGVTADLEEGDVFEIEHPTGRFDVAVCTRFLNWLTTDEMGDVLQELGRVTAGRIIVSVRLGDGSARAFPPKVFVKAAKRARLQEHRRLALTKGYWMVDLRHRA